MDDNKEIKVSDHASGNRIQKICLIGALILVAAAAAACFFAFANGSRAVKQAFDRERKAAEESVYQSFYEQGFKAGEEEYHVKNRAVITLGNLRETANLEVLSVSDVAFMIENPNSENNNIQSWIQVPGTGVYTVDLAAGEFLVDDERSMVFVRVPKPELLPMNRIQEDISSNLQYYEFAEKSARSLLENLIRSVNSEIPDLKVEIEFF